MSRLADYFAVVGFDHGQERSGQSCGVTLQRFPEKDWDDCPFTNGIEHFCQPSGWRLSTNKEAPTFFVSVLTDIDADRHYAACLTFFEDVVVEPPKIDDEDAEEQDLALVRSSKLYAPKSLVLVSKLDYFETFRNCLGLIYTVYMENMSVELETLIGNVLGCIQVPPPGGPQIRFSIGAGDRQALQPPLCSTLPMTQTSVALLFKHLGISNALSVFCAALTDHKILFHTQSYTRLTAASHALTALMYPLKYSYVYIPILPAGLIEVLNTPTPFIAGVHTSLRPDNSDLLDVIIVDLDGGSIRVPENVHLSLMPEPILSRVKHSLNLILLPDLLSADHAFAPVPPRTPALDVLDKEIRAVILRMFAELFAGYRSCLTIIRIHPEPFITFHKANFLGHRGLVEDDFVCRVLDSMCFCAFVAERGPPYRVCDIFDEVFASMPDTLEIEEKSAHRLLHNIQDLGQQLYFNENPNPQPYAQKVARPPDGAHTRVHQPVFPKVDRVRIQEIIEEGMAKQGHKAKFSAIRPPQPRIVPIGAHVSTAGDRMSIVSTNARRLEVLRNCVGFIFENKISDARKIFPAVLRALKSRVARLALVEELSFHSNSNRAMLEHQQFDLVVRLLNCALQNDSSMDENGVAAAILPLATAFCRKLCTGVIQFAYTCVQEHAVWGNPQFWEATFYNDVQREIRQLYLPRYEEHLMPDQREKSAWNHSSSQREIKGTTPDQKRRSVTAAMTRREISALEIAAEQLRVWHSLSKEQQEEMISNEESTVYSQAIHYANRMVYLRLPLDVSRNALEPVATPHLEKDSASSNITNSIAESDSLDAESGFDEQEVTEVGANTVKFVLRFIDKVCSDSNVSADHIRQLHIIVPGVVAMHMEILEGVFRESKRLPPIQKPKILTPVLLPGEEIVMEGLRVYLVADGREEGCGGNMGGPPLLPAEGAIFLTTYRVLFKGTPCDPLACEQVVCRSFPVSTLTREKQIKVQYLAHIDQYLQDGLQLRANTFQLMKIGFDEEVNTEDIEALRKLMNKVRNPPSVINTFAFTGYILSQPNQLTKNKEKNASLKGFAKRTLMKTAKKAGFKSKDSTSNQSKRSKYVLPTPPLARKTLAMTGLHSERHSTTSSSYDDDLSVIDEQDIAYAIQTDSKNVDRLSERSYCRDWARLGFGSLSGTNNRMRTEPWRLTVINTTYQVCRSYPAVLVVPSSVQDDSIRKFARSHRQHRFPVVTWRHPRTKAVLLRASGFHGKGVMGMLKGHHTQPADSGIVLEVTTSLEEHQEQYFQSLVLATPKGGSSSGETSTSIEQEKYFSSVVSATPMGNWRGGEGGSGGVMSDSLTSLDSLLLAELTPDALRRNPLARAVSSLRSSGGKAKMSARAGRTTSRGRSTEKAPLSATSTLAPPPLVPPSAHHPERSKSPFSRQWGSFRASLGRGPTSTQKEAPPSLGRIGSLRDGGSSSSKQRPVSTMGFGYSGAPQTAKQNGSVDMSELSESAPHSFHKATLYVLGEKTQMKGIKLDCFPKCDFIPIDYSEVRHVKSSFKKLMRACVPSAPYTDPERGFMRAFEESEWLPQLQSILQIAGATVDLLDVQGSSVMISLEDGWDFTTQVLCIAQLLMDPYYRTIEGFQTLIEKEWLSFGHRFTHRSNQTAANQASGFAPVFLQFLDVVHQIHNQFPLSFEFNQFFLKFLAYHYVSNRFRTFMLDNEFERMEAGWLLEESGARRRGHESGGGGFSGGDMGAGLASGDSPSSGRRGNAGMSVWEYIHIYHERSPLFYNFMFSPLDQEEVLRPYSNISNLVIWEYFIYENLSHGSPYDLEVVEREMSLDEEQALIDGPMAPNARRLLNFCYDNVHQLQPDACTYALQELLRLEQDLSGSIGRWKSTWDKLESPARDQLHRQVSFNTQCVRSHGRSIHKRSTIELLVKGKMLGEAAKMFSQPHRFEKFTYTTPAYCDYCSHVLWGLVKTGMRCMDCGFNCHEKCMPHVPKNCAKLRPVSEASTSSASISKVSLTETSSVTAEHQTHSGYLFKRGALLKGWKQRWFVLDSMKHQLRYYDSQDDLNNCKGFIDLAEVTCVASLKNVQGALKKVDDNAFFEMKTVRRVYNFGASDSIKAQEWIEQIQSCIQ